MLCGCGGNPVDRKTTSVVSKCRNPSQNNGIYFSLEMTDLIYVHERRSHIQGALIAGTFSEAFASARPL